MCSNNHIKQNFCKPVFACEADQVENCKYFETDDNVSCKHLKSSEECTCNIAKSNAVIESVHGILAQRSIEICEKQLTKGS
jgi:hypothetical protein